MLRKCVRPTLFNKEIVRDILQSKHKALNAISLLQLDPSCAATDGGSLRFVCRTPKLDSTLSMTSEFCR